MLDFYTNCEGICITPNKILCGSELYKVDKRERNNAGYYSDQEQTLLSVG